MESAYTTAMEIADHYCKELLHSVWKGQFPDDYIKNELSKPWAEIKKTASVQLLNVHKDVFQSAYVVLGKNKTVKSQQVVHLQDAMAESNNQVKQQPTISSTCTVPLHPEGCQCDDHGAYAKKVELHWENCGE